jgi:hypothetical protein
VRERKTHNKRIGLFKKRIIKWIRLKKVQ